MTVANLMGMQILLLLFGKFYNKYGGQRCIQKHVLRFMKWFWWRECVRGGPTGGLGTEAKSFWSGGCFNYQTLLDNIKRKKLLRGIITDAKSWIFYIFDLSMRGGNICTTVELITISVCPWEILGLLNFRFNQYNMMEKWWQADTWSLASPGDGGDEDYYVFLWSTWWHHIIIFLVNILRKKIRIDSYIPILNNHFVSFCS